MRGQTCDTNATESAAKILAERQQVLLQHGVEEMDGTVSAALSRQIRDLKDALVQTVDASLACTPLEADAPAIDARLSGILPGNPPKQVAAAQADAARTYDVYGNSLFTTVETPLDAPHLRIIQAGFYIQCGGQDVVLLVYEPGEHGWRRALRWQSAEYAVISDAFGGFYNYVLLPARRGKPWRVAFVHGMPWCTSRWSGYKIDLLEPAPGAARLIWHSEGGYVRESEPRLSARPDGFELRLDVGTIESEQMVRKGVLRYKVDGDRVERIAPIAVDGRGFVDAWLQAPWSEAKQWSAVAGAMQFTAVHAEFEQGHNDASVTYSYGPVRSCFDKSRYEVEIDATPGGPEFYAIQEGSGGYTLVNYGTTQDDRCSGPNLMKKR